MTMFSMPGHTRGGDSGFQSRGDARALVPRMLPIRLAQKGSGETAYALEVGHRGSPIQAGSSRLESEAVV